MSTAALAPYDAVLLLSFGGPDEPADVMPFLENVTAGRGIPPGRLESVAEHYYRFGGRSPINEQNRALLAALRREFDSREWDLPLLWGNRNWQPYLTDVLRDAHSRGVRHVVTILTSAYSSYSSCRQYRENLAAALTTLAGEGRSMDVDKVRVYFNHPAFVETMVQTTCAAVRQLPERVRGKARLAFVTHSIPVAMANASGREGGWYEAQHRSVAAQVASGVGAQLRRDVDYDLVYCSRSGAPSQPWLEPDVNDHLRECAGAGVPAVVAVPIGFVSDHMEVRFDLDTEAKASAKRLGLPFARAATVGDSPRFVAGLADLVAERAALARGEHPAEPTTGGLASCHVVCPAGCCTNEEHPAPAACGAGWAQPEPAPAS